MHNFIVLVLVFVFLPQSAFAATDYWVTTDRLERKTCPDSKCGVVGQLFFREKAVVLEKKGEWARITESYDAFCENGSSKYVENGNSECSEDNGIVGGQFAEWVKQKSLSQTRPEDPAKNAQGDYALVKGSDDYRLYKDIFAKKASELIAEGKCTESDFQEMGGWVKSMQNKNEPIYFLYCGGMTLSNKVYLNAKTGEILQ